MFTSPEIGLERARASARVRALANDTNAHIDRPSALTLAESPWPHHQLDGGWVYMCLYTRGLQEGDNKTDLIGNVRSTWRSILANPHATGDNRLHAAFALSHSGLWLPAVKSETEWSERRDQQYTQSVLGLWAVILSEKSRDLNPKEASDVAGALAEIIVALTLNEHAQKRGRATMTLPAQSWNDDRHLQPSSNFDLWQVSGGQWKKVQVKGTKRAHNRSVNYDKDIAVVILNDHLQKRFGVEVNRFMAQEMGVEEIVSLGESIQESIDDHFGSAG